MFVSLVILPLLFAFVISLMPIIFDSNRLVKILFLVGAFSPWPIFLLSLNGLPLDTVLGGWTRSGGVEVVFGDFNFYFVLAELIVFSLVAIYSYNYFKSSKLNKEFALLLLMHGGLLGAFISRDLFNFYVYSEIASVSGFALIGISKIKGSRKAAFRYITFFFISSYLFLLSIGIIYSETGYLNLEMIRENLVMSLGIRVGIGLGFVSLILKAGIFPLFFWLPDAHSKAQTPVSALLSGIMVKTSIYGMMLFVVYLPMEFLSFSLKIVAFSSMFFGMVVAFLQTDVKKLLAYSTVSQMGYVLLGLAVLNIDGAIYHSLTHALSKTGLFLGVGLLIHSQNTRDIRKLSYDNYVTVFSVLVLSLSIAGIYPLIGSISKGILLSGINGVWYYLFYLVSIGTLVYYAKLNYFLLSNGPGIDLRLDKSIIPFVSSVLVIGFGFYFGAAIKITDLAIIGIAILVFATLNYFKALEIEIPSLRKKFSGVGEENNFYAAIFVTFLILILIQGL